MRHFWGSKAEENSEKYSSSTRISKVSALKYTKLSTDNISLVIEIMLAIFFGPLEQG